MFQQFLNKLFNKRYHHWQQQSQIIQNVLAEKGVWEEFVEWRISTITELRIEIISKNDTTWYQVKVTCDQEFQCCCPTLERAIEFMSIYESLIPELFASHGWPSWTSKTTMQAEH
jgi:hypothetical protein